MTVSTTLPDALGNSIPDKTAQSVGASLWQEFFGTVASAGAGVAISGIPTSVAPATTPDLTTTTTAGSGGCSE